MRKLVTSAKKPGYLRPMAMYSYPIMPPPKKVEKNLGEQRIIGFSGVGISVGKVFVPEPSGGNTALLEKEEEIARMGATAQSKVGVWVWSWW